MRQGRFWSCGVGALLCLLALSGCGAGGSSSGSSSAQALWDDEGQARDPNELRLALNYVAFQESAGAPVISQASANEVLKRVNALYSPCAIRFGIENFQQVNSEEKGIPFAISRMGELDEVRAPFQDESRLVVINTGKWNHSSLGWGNAWTAMPGSDLMGVVMDLDVLESAEIVAHELGHYLNLDHVSDTSNLMNPVIYPDSETLEEGQCNEMREIAQTTWSKMLR